jgi:hypothetical protein
MAQVVQPDGGEPASPQQVVALAVTHADCEEVAEGGSNRWAEPDLRKLDAALRSAEQARDVEIADARLRAISAALRTTAEQVSGQRGIGPEL